MSGRRFRPVEKYKEVGEVIEINNTYQTFLIQKPSGEKQEIAQERLVDGPYKQIDNRLYKLEEELICRECSNKPMYMDNADRYFCPVCE